MPMVRAAGVLLCAATALSGCTTQMAAAPAAGVSLAGAWKIDHGARQFSEDEPTESRDLHNVAAALVRPRAFEAIH